MHYSNSPGHVRVDKFKPSGKWYETFTIDMSNVYNNTSIHDAVLDAIKASGVNMRYSDTEPYTFVCLAPYHQFAHPVIVKPATGDF